MKKDKIMGAVVILAVVIAVGAAIVLVGNGVDPGDVDDSSVLSGPSGTEESTVGNSLLQSTPEYVKAVAAGVIILCAILIVRRELN